MGPIGESDWEAAQEPDSTEQHAAALVATAKVYDLTLVTADERILSVPGIRVLPNR